MQLAEQAAGLGGMLSQVTDELGDAAYGPWWWLDMSGRHASSVLCMMTGKGDTVDDDVVLILTQFELPPGFGAADLEELRREVSAGPLRTGIDVEPGSDERDPFTAAAVLFVIHFVSQHGMDIALGVAEGAFWDGIKKTFGRLRKHKAADAPAARVGEIGRAHV